MAYFLERTSEYVIQVAQFILTSSVSAFFGNRKCDYPVDYRIVWTCSQRSILLPSIASK